MRLQKYNFVDVIVCYKITDFEAFYGNFSKVKYQWKVFLINEKMICHEDIKDWYYVDIILKKV